MSSPVKKTFVVQHRARQVDARRQPLLPAASAPPARRGRTARPDGFAPVAARSPVAPPAGPALPPEVARLLHEVARRLEPTPSAAQRLAAATAVELTKSPEVLGALGRALPFVESSAAGAGGRVVASSLPQAANAQTVKALLELGKQVGGPSGRRLMAAALRGLNSGKGLAGVAAELTATLAKLGARSGALGAVSQGLLKALPVIGNAVNLLAVASSLKALYDCCQAPNATNAQKLVRVLHLAATVVGCFIPEVGLAATLIDLGEVATRTR
ncbi:MAG: hypothetical protein JNK82_44675 [Myxococcaceae bacterium]|nr:hypothetical protein [Myxococcaceae bacterium]